MKSFNLSEFAVRERAITLFLLVAIFTSGALAFLKLGRAEDPAFTVKQMTMVTAWPGATAQQMQDLVAEPMEKRMQELRWYDRTETFTRPGLAFTTLYLLDSTPPHDVPDEFYQARKKILDAESSRPTGVSPTLVNDEYSDVTFALYALKALGQPQRMLTREAEAMRQRLLHVAGVKKVNIIGEQPERIFVDISYERLATLGLSPNDIFIALHGQNAMTPAGSIEAKGPQIQVRLDGALNDLEKIRNTPIFVNGNTLKLADVADVQRGYEDPSTFLIRNNGEEALVLGVVMRDGWNGLSLGKALEQEAGAINQELPVGMSLSKITDQSVNIDEAVGEFMLKFFVALTVVMIVSLLSLGWRVGLIVAAAVPLTLAAVFVIMLATGRDFDRITLGSLILALGLLVDDAIIAIETMVVRMEEGYDRLQASAYAWSHTAAPMLSGTLVTIIGFLPVGFARSTAGEYAGNIFWIVGFALITSWLVAVFFTPYIGVKLLPDIKKVEGGHTAIYDTKNYNRFRRVLGLVIRRKWIVAGIVIFVFALAIMGMGSVRKQFFPSSDRPEVLIEIQMPQGTSINQTSAASADVEKWLKTQSETKIVTSYIGQGAPRFYLAMAPELPDPSFAKIVVLTENEAAREALKVKLRAAVADGLAPQARVRVTQLVFGPYSPYPVAFRVMGPNADKVREIAESVRGIMQADPNMRTVNTDWSERVPTVHLVLNQDRLQAFGLSSQEAGEQLQFLLKGTAVTQVREGIRTVDVMARSSGDTRLDPGKIGDFTLVGKSGKRIPLSQIADIQVRQEDPILRRRDRTPTITVRGDIADGTQPPDVSMVVWSELQPLIAKLPSGYRIEMAGAIEEAGKANDALAPLFPIMLLLTMIVIIFQVRSLAAMAMVLATAPLGLVGVVPTLMIFHQPFGFNALIGLIGLAGILMRNTLILIGQIHTNEAQGLGPYDAVVEATIQRSRPVLLTALAAVLAFIPLTQSVFWGTLAYTLIGGTFGGTIMTLVFLPALYAIWFKIKPQKPRKEPTERDLSQARR